MIFILSHSFEIFKSDYRKSLKRFIPISFSTTEIMSGMEYNSTAFVGCDNGQVNCFLSVLVYSFLLALLVFQNDYRRYNMHFILLVLCLLRSCGWNQKLLRREL